MGGLGALQVLLYLAFQPVDARGLVGQFLGLALAVAPGLALQFGMLPLQERQPAQVGSLAGATWCDSMWMSS